MRLVLAIVLATYLFEGGVAMLVAQTAARVIAAPFAPITQALKGASP